MVSSAVHDGYEGLLLWANERRLFFAWPVSCTCNASKEPHYSEAGMKLSQQIKKYVESVATETLETFVKVSDVAKQNLRARPTPPSNVFASVNTLTSVAAVQQFEEISRASREASEILSREPAVARVIARDDSGSLRTIYICRTSPIQIDRQFASYRAPLGRLASLQIGGALTVPMTGQSYELVEKALLHPSELKEGWDSEDTILSSEDIRALTIESLRSLIGTSAEAVEEDMVEQLLAEERAKVNLVEGVRRRVITKMALRDQPILDEFQDEIFRLPLNSQLLILGPPGTGKTTTLIRRLGQKLDHEFLEEDEKKLVETIKRSTAMPHAQSWLMFTPTELLKQYLKEAFAKEGIAASDQRIKTWQDLRHDLARNVFGVLRTVSGSGSLIMKESCPTLTEDAFVNSRQWYDDFDKWQRSTYLERLKHSAGALKDDSDSQVATLGNRLWAIAARSDHDGIPSTFEALAKSVEAAQAILAQLRQKSDAILKADLNRQLNRDREFLASLLEFIKDLKISEVEDEGDDLEVEDDEDSAKSRTDTAVAMSAYRGTVRTTARAAISRRALKKSSPTAKIVEWIGSRMMSTELLRELGSNLVLQSHLRVFVNPVKRYIDSIPGRYRTYRRVRREHAAWYTQNEVNPSEVHPLEVDVVLLAILRGLAELLGRGQVLRDIDDPTWVPLRNALEQYRAQILVDEATDFSPIQLACMYSLAHPRSRSFFACGDFNQRLTRWGTRTPEQMLWVCADLRSREIAIAYRQSRQLNDFSLAIIDLTGGAKPKVSLPSEVDNDGVSPVLLENASESGRINWLAKRIMEIEGVVRPLPSVAIFVPSEAEVLPLASALNQELQEQNLRVVPCPNGQVVGHQNEIRVFDIQHIKGLEFEAVFFIDLDLLAAEKADLFPSYLYVGSTRAATYLGITCRRSLPALMAPIAKTFVTKWES